MCDWTKWYIALVPIIIGGIVVGEIGKPWHIVLTIILVLYMVLLSNKIANK